MWHWIKYNKLTRTKHKYLEKIIEITSGIEKFLLCRNYNKRFRAYFLVQFNNYFIKRNFL